MKLQFKHQKFQADAARAVVDVFAGQPYLTVSYRMDPAAGYYQHTLTEEEDFTGWSNQRIVPQLTDAKVLEQIQKIQRRNQIEPSQRLEGKYNLTIEMETGVGKTYTYCKTMYELNRHYGWSKFIVVVPSVAIREGVYKSLQMTQDHFAEEYGKKIRFFIYNSAHLTEIDRFAADSSIHVMIINAQAFNARGKDARRIYMKLDKFRSRRPIDIIAGTNPILIIDEPQSVEGKQTKERLKEFHPLFTLRYSATHKSDSIYNMVYRLDAMEAYNKRLVKKIAVKGITESASTATESYLYLQGINLSKGAPTATLQFDCKTKSGTIRTITRIVSERYNLYHHSGELDEYRNGFVVKRIDGRDDSIEFLNGIKLYAGDVMGRVSEEQIRRLQIRETILSHLERERQLFRKGIKVLSLFFIDQVEHYKKYDDAGRPRNGIFADMFEEEYKDVLENMQLAIGEDEYLDYLGMISASSTHAGYFSVDRKGRLVNGRLSDKKGGISDDKDAYDLIMKNKELLLDQDPRKSPVRFVFSHSALREGWDNPNVFQICTLKQSASEVRKRQEVGRGLRLCVNQEGERMDAAVLGNDVHTVNVLTVIASESYDSFAKGLQSEIAEAVAYRPRAVSEEFFMQPENARSSKVELSVEEEKLAMPEFKALWDRISPKSVYRVNFDTDELIDRCVAALDSKLRVFRVYLKVESGTMDDIASKEALVSGASFVRKSTAAYSPETKIKISQSVKYDLIGKLVDETGLTRKAVLSILKGIHASVFEQFKENPEEFIAKAARLINEEKAAAVIRHIAYEVLDEHYGTDVLTEPTIKGRLGVNAVKTRKHLYDYLVYDSAKEKEFAQLLDTDEAVAVYVKLPDRFYISTPVGHYNPDWAIAFYEGTVKHIYFVAETKGAMSPMQLRLIEEAKIHCAREHFRAIGKGEVVYDVVDSYQSLLELLKA